MRGLKETFPYYLGGLKNYTKYAAAVYEKYTFNRSPVLLFLAIQIITRRRQITKQTTSITVVQYAFSTTIETKIVTNTVRKIKQMKIFFVLLIRGYSVIVEQLKSKSEIRDRLANRGWL